MSKQMTYDHDHGHTLKHDHDDIGPHEHNFSHHHDHEHPKDGSTNKHMDHEHLELNGPLFAHSEHHSPPEATFEVSPPGDMNEPGETSKETMNPPSLPGGKSGKSRSLFWGE
jgi:hypothetical protein